MMFQVIHHRSGKNFATYAVHQFEHAVAAALDLTMITGEQFAVATAAGERRVLFTPQPTTGKPSPP